jgi:hypothetical protein
MLGLAMTVTIQSVGLLDLTSITERTNPVTSDPFIFTVVFCRDVRRSGSVSRLLDLSSGTFACATSRGTRNGSAALRPYAAVTNW